MTKDKRLIKIFACIFILTFVTAIFLVCYNTFSSLADSTENKIYCQATIDDEFDDKSVIVIIDKSLSRFIGVSEEVSTNLYSCGAKSIKDLTELPENLLNLDGSINVNKAGKLAEHYKIHAFRQILCVELETANKAKVIEFIHEVEKIKGILYAGPNYIEVNEGELPTNRYIKSQFRAFGESTTANVKKAWDVWENYKGTNDVRVGVIDTGINKHEDLDVNVVEGYDFYNKNNITDDDLGGHGTAVAGIIGAVSNNDIGILGMARNVKLVPLQTAYETRDSGWHYRAERLEAIKYATSTWGQEDQISILNHSIGGFGENIELLAQIENYPGLFVWAAGNEGKNVDSFKNINQFNMSNIISVGAIDGNNNYGKWSSGETNYGDAVNIFAPGVRVISTYGNEDNFNDYADFSGTSYAAPFVSGVAALMLSCNPDLDGESLKNKLLKGADEISITTPSGSKQVKKIDPYKSLCYATGRRVTYNVEFDKDGGVGGTDSIYATYESQMPKISLPQKYGYTFKFYYDENGAIFYESKAGLVYVYNSYPYAHDIKLTAYWEMNSYDLAFEIVGVENVSYVNYGSYKYTDTVQISAQNYDGYKFKYWEDGSAEETRTISIKTIVDSWGTDKQGSLSSSGGGKQPLKSEISSYHFFGTQYFEEKSCIAAGTLITLADGSQKAVETLTGNEMLLVWNMYKGTFDSAPILCIDSEPISTYEVIKLYFSDGTTVDVISEHGFWEYDLKEYVYLDDNAFDYIGHWFNKYSVDELGTRVQLVNVEIVQEMTTAWSPVTYGHLCYYVNGMLSMPGGIDGLFNIFEVDSETMMYDAEAMAADIEEYGLFTYEEFTEILPVSEVLFEAVNGEYLKVAIGKGMIDLDTLSRLIERYSVFFQE